MTAGKRRALLAIVAGGLIAGTLDLTQAFILFGHRVPLVIAAGLLGKQAFHPGAGSTWSPPILEVSATYILGVLLHFFIATSVAAIYYAASRKLRFLIEHPLVCGLFYGMAVELVMSYIVLPLSALHSTGPYSLHDVLLGLVVHMFVVGLPISFSIRRFAK
jgi:Na+/alanine symporter